MGLVIHTEGVVRLAAFAGEVDGAIDVGALVAETGGEGSRDVVGRVRAVGAVVHLQSGGELERHVRHGARKGFSEAEKVGRLSDGLVHEPVGAQGAEAADFVRVVGIEPRPRRCSVLSEFVVVDQMP